MLQKVVSRNCNKKKITDILKRKNYLGSNNSFEIICHFTASYGRHLLTRDINQTAHLCAANWVK